MKVSGSYVWGFGIGILVAVFLAVLLISLARRKAGGRFDERQQQVRCQAYRAAFWVLAAYALINGFLPYLGVAQWADPLVSAFLGVCLALVVFVVVCVAKDSYFSLNEKPGFYLILFTVIALINIVLSWEYIKTGQMAVNGVLTYHAMNMIVAALALAVILALAVKRLCLALSHRKEQE